MPKKSGHLALARMARRRAAAQLKALEEETVEVEAVRESGAALDAMVVEWAEGLVSGATEIRSENAATVQTTLHAMVQAAAVVLGKTVAALADAAD